MDENKMTDREKLIELLSSYFGIGDSYAYNLTRVKSAFAVGTMSLEDFEEFDDDTVADIADYLLSHGVTFEKQGEWEKYGYKWMCNKCRAKLNVDGTPESNGIYYCPECGARMKGEKT